MVLEEFFVFGSDLIELMFICKITKSFKIMTSGMTFQFALPVVCSILIHLIFNSLRYDSTSGTLSPPFVFEPIKIYLFVVFFHVYWTVRN